MGKARAYMEATKTAESMRPEVFYRIGNRDIWGAAFDREGRLQVNNNLFPLCLEDAHRFMLWLTENLS